MSSKLYYLNKNKSFSVIKLEKGVSHSEAYGLLLKTKTDIRSEIKDWLVRVEDFSQTNLSYCFAGNNIITIIPFGVAVKIDEMSAKILGSLGPHKNISAKSQ